MHNHKEYMRVWSKNNREKISEYNKKWRLKNKDRLKKQGQEYREANCEKIKASRKEYREKNKEKKWESDKKYRLKNREYYKEYGKEYREKNKEYFKEYRKEYYIENKERIKLLQLKWRRSEGGKTCRREYKKNRLLTNPEFKLNHLIGGAIRRSLKGNKGGNHWESILGYSISDLIRHLKQTIPQKYNWYNDFIKTGNLHIDHIIPVSAFEFNKPEDFQFQECWSLKNLRLLPAKENLIKGTKLIKSYQLALKM